MTHGMRMSLLPGLLTLACAAALPAQAETLRAQPNGFDEVPTLSSPARSEFRARVNRAETGIEYELEYSGLETPVTQAHIHLGRAAVNGGVMVFLCTNLNNGPAGTPACPNVAGSDGTLSGGVSGTWTAESVVGGATAQGIAAGEFDEMVRAIRAKATYVNIHTQRFPAGELRDQVKARGASHE